MATEEHLMTHLVAVARPGDTILIGFDRTLSDQEFDDLREGFNSFTETTGIHIGFVEHATSMVVLRPEGGTDDAEHRPSHDRGTA